MKSQFAKETGITFYLILFRVSCEKHIILDEHQTAFWWIKCFCSLKKMHKVSLIHPLYSFLLQLILPGV